MMKFRENEDAVSPVIGVILMVAITVILAAVIAAFVFGMGSNIETSKTVAVTASQNGNDIVVNYKGGADAKTLNYLKVTVRDNTQKAMYCYMHDDDSGAPVVTNTTVGAASPTDINKTALLEVGSTLVFENEGTAERDHVVVTGHFIDGSEHVVLDTYV